MTSVLLIPQVLISGLSWVQLVFSINRYRGMSRFLLVDMWSLLILMDAAFVRWAAAIATVRASFAYQGILSVAATVLAWVSFALIYNEAFAVPTRQQVAALVASVCVAVLWEVNNRLLFDQTCHTT